MSRPFPRAPLFAVLPVVGLACGCTAPPPRSPPPSVLLVTVGGVGVERGDLPALQALATSGTSFTRAYTPSPDPEVALAGLLSAAPPPVSGARGPDRPLPPDRATVATVLRAAGWRTVAVGAIDSSLQRGFDDVVSAPGADAEAVRAAIGLLGGDQPTFAWVHLSDAEWPCRGGLPAASDRCSAALERVDAAVAELGAAWAPGPGRWLAVAGVAPLVLLPDGGRSIGAVLDDAHLRVPMVIIGEGWPVAVEASPVGLVDLGATLWGLSGLPASAANLRFELPEGVWHEARAGARWLGLVPLVGWSFAGGRYVEGGWGATYPLVPGGEAVAALPEHRTSRGPSVRPEAREVAARREPDRLAPVRWRGAGDAGDPQPGPGLGDPRDAGAALALVSKVQWLVGEGLAGPADRDLGRLAALRRGSWAVHWLAADIAVARGDLVGAGERLERLLVETDSPAAALRRAGLALQLDQPEVARDDAAEAQRAAPEGIEPLRVTGLADVRCGDVLGGWAALAELVRRGEPAPLLRAELALAEGDARGALQALDPADSDPEVAALRGRALVDRGQLDEAATALWRVLELAPYHVPARRLLAEIALEQGAPEEALRLMAPLRSVGMSPHDTEVVQAAEAALVEVRGPQLPKRPWR